MRWSKRMKTARVAMKVLPVLLGWAAIACPPAAAQNPIIPIVVDTAVPIIIKAVKPAPLPEGQQKFEGFVMNANTAQITLRALGNDLAIRTFSLSEQAAAKMQQVI